MMGLPEGWALAKLADLGDWSSGGTPSRSNPSYFGGDIPFVKTGDLRDETLTKIDETLTASGLANSSAKIFPAGTLLIAMYGATIGRTARLSFDAATNQACAALLENEANADSMDYVWKYLISQTETLKAAGKGGAQPNISQTVLKDYPIPLPPLPEQRRIVRKLDTLSARSTAACTHLTAIEKLVERYRTAVLEAAFRAAWDAGCNNTIAGCLEHAETGLVRSKAEQTADEGYPYIRMNHYDLAGRWNDRDLTYVAATSSEFERYQLRAKDLLFNTRNSAELVGKVAIWPEGKDGYLFNNNLLRMRFSEDVVPAFAFWQMSSPPFRRYIKGFISATTSVAAIYQRSLMAAPFWVPDTDEQRKIVRRIEAAFAKIDRLAAEAAKALKLLGHLDQRILAKAFAGDLVPQDPNDEPAETLLARIRAERAAAPKSKRGRKKAST
jgi:type I restriction enzyme S subunit